VDAPGTLVAYLSSTFCAIGVPGTKHQEKIKMPFLKMATKATL